MTRTLAPMCLHSREELQTYVATAQDKREELEALIGADLGVDLESLDVLESFLLDRYRNNKVALALDQRGVLDAAARQVGLVLILNIDGARWDINLDDPRNVYYRLPIIALPDGSEECPNTMVTAALDRRTGDYMRGIAAALAEDCAAFSKPKAKTKPKAKKKTTAKAKTKPKAKKKTTAKAKRAVSLRCRT